MIGRRSWWGLLLVVAGLAVLGWLGWQFWGTNWVSQREHRQIADRLETGWDEGQVEIDARGTSTAALLRVPRFGDDYRVPILEGDSDSVLAAGVGHLPRTAAVGEVGNYVLAAHRVTHGEPFRDLPDLRPGDEVVVQTAEKTYTYVLDTAGDDLSVSFDAGWVLDPEPVNPARGVGPAEGADRLITLTTCAELFHTDQRLVAFGHLADVTSRR